MHRGGRRSHVVSQNQRCRMRVRAVSAPPLMPLLAGRVPSTSTKLWCHERQRVPVHVRGLRKPGSLSCLPCCFRPARSVLSSPTRLCFRHSVLCGHHRPRRANRQLWLWALRSLSCFLQALQGFYTSPASGGYDRSSAGPGVLVP